jgi:hypothetical protein
MLYLGVESAAHLIWPPFSAMNMAAWIPMLLAEISTGCWLLIRSVSFQKLRLTPNATVFSGDV